MNPSRKPQPAADSRTARPAILALLMALGCATSAVSAAPFAIAPVMAERAPPPTAAMPANPVKAPAPVSRSKADRRNKPKRLSKATLAALQPGAGTQAVAVMAPAGNLVAPLSPVVRDRHPARQAEAPAAVESPLARALIAPPAMTRKVSSAGQVLPAQEEALALARQQAAPEVAATLPEEPGARARKDVETGPMRLRVRRQAVQMSVEFPFQ